MTELIAHRRQSSQPAERDFQTVRANHIRDIGRQIDRRQKLFYGTFFCWVSCIYRPMQPMRERSTCMQRASYACCNYAKLLLLAKVERETNPIFNSRTRKKGRDPCSFYCALIANEPNNLKNRTNCHGHHSDSPWWQCIRNSKQPNSVCVQLLSLSISSFNSER